MLQKVYANNQRGLRSASIYGTRSPVWVIRSRCGFCRGSPYGRSPPKADTISLNQKSLSRPVAIRPDQSRTL
jgi:hypothetical protein